MSVNSSTLHADSRHLSGTLLFLLASLAALGAFSTNIILPAFPAIGADLGVTTRDLAVTLSGFFIAFACGQLLFGPLSDRMGRKRLVLSGLILFVVGSIVSAVAPSLPILLVGRVIQALGACCASVLSRAIARDLFDGEALARALSLIMIAMAAAPGFSPLAGSALSELVGWRLTFVVVAAFGSLLAISYWAHLDETLPFERRSSATLDNVTRTYRELLGDRRFILPALAVSLIIGGLYTFFATAPAILMTRHGLSSTQLGLHFASTVFLVFAAGLSAPRLARRWGREVIGATGLALSFLGSVALIAGADAPSIVAFSGAIALYLLGMGLINPLGTALALQPFGARAGSASALLGFLQMGCAAIGASVATALPFSSTTSLGVILTAGSSLALLAFIPVARQQMSEVRKSA